jgi:antirestriction protein
MISLPNPKMTQTQMTLKIETEDFITHLIEDNYHDADIYEFIENHGEDNLVEYYETYVQLGDDHSYDAVDAFVEEFGFECLENFEDAYHGQWESEADFAESFVNDCFDINLPDFIVIDWEATWERNLRHDFIFNDGFVFDRNF